MGREVVVVGCRVGLSLFSSSSSATRARAPVYRCACVSFKAKKKIA